MKRPLARLLNEAALPLLALWLLSTFIGTLARVDGNSMNPTLHSGEVLWLQKYPRWLHAWSLSDQPYQRGDIVIFKAPEDSEYAWETLHLLGWDLRHRPYNIKRVVGVPGDRVELRSGKLWRNGQQVTERYVSADAAQDEAPVKVGPEQLYVMGDNRLLGESVDSRFYGPVNLKDVAGKANWHLLPPRRLAR